MSRRVSSPYGRGRYRPQPTEGPLESVPPPDQLAKAAEEPGVLWASFRDKPGST
ncbi:MAG: hypothetical protein ABIT16_09835 [Croceibacterium sp.]